MLRTGGLHLPQRRLDPTLRRPDLPERRWAATEVSWYLLRLDFHQQVIMSLQDGGNANIFDLDLRSRQLGQLTNVPAINTAPCYSPDGTGYFRCRFSG